MYGHAVLDLQKGFKKWDGLASCKVAMLKKQRRQDRGALPARLAPDHRSGVS